MVLNIWLFISSHSGSFEIVSKQTKKKTPKAKKNFIQTDNIPIVFLSTWLILQGVFYGENEKMRKYAESTD